MRRVLVVALVAVAVVSCVPSFGSPSSNPQSSPTPRPTLDSVAPPSSSPANSIVLGGEDCLPPSPRIASPTGSLGVLLGTAPEGSPTKLFVSVTPLLSAGPEWKLIVRMTGSGDLVFSAQNTDGTKVQARMVEPHSLGSSLDVFPGSEWGVFVIFPTSGCWKLRAQRSNEYADVWVLVLP